MSIDAQHITEDVFLKLVKTELVNSKNRTLTTSLIDKLIIDISNSINDFLIYKAGEETAKTIED